MTMRARPEEARSNDSNRGEWRSAYSTWPVQPNPDWSLDEARHRNSEIIPADPLLLPAWSNRPDSYGEIVDLTHTRANDLAVRAARARSLTDPLGAKGFRQTRRRVKQETAARRKVFAVSVTAFATCFGLILHANSDSGGSSVSVEAAAFNAASSGDGFAAFTFLEPTSTPSPTPLATSTPSSAAAVTSKLNKAATTGSRTAAEPTDTATVKPTQTPEPVATATKVAVQQAPKKHTRTKSS